MVAFFTSLTIIGISVVIISIILVMLDRKRDLDDKEEYISVRNELRELLEDSNQMVDELNRFSDYVVTKVDEKCSEFMSLMNQVPEDIVHEHKVISKNESLKEESHTTPNIPDNSIAAEIEENIEIKEDIDNIEQRQPNASLQDTNNMSINPKHNEVMRLFETGMTDNDIAKALNMGKGEVQLIVGLNLHKIKLQ